MKYKLEFLQIKCKDSLPNFKIEITINIEQKTAKSVIEGKFNNKHSAEIENFVYLDIKQLNSKMELRFFDLLKNKFLGKEFVSINQLYKENRKEIQIDNQQKQYGSLFVGLTYDQEKKSFSSLKPNICLTILSILFKDDPGDFQDIIFRIKQGKKKLYLDLNYFYDDQQKEIQFNNIILNVKDKYDLTFICEVSRLLNVGFEQEKNTFISELKIEKEQLGQMITSKLKNGHGKKVGELRSILGEHQNVELFQTKVKEIQYFMQENSKLFKSHQKSFFEESKISMERGKIKLTPNTQNFSHRSIKKSKLSQYPSKSFMFNNVNQRNERKTLYSSKIQSSQSSSKQSQKQSVSECSLNNKKEEDSLSEEKPKELSLMEMESDSQVQDSQLSQPNLKEVNSECESSSQSSSDFNEESQEKKDSVTSTVSKIDGISLDEIQDEILSHNSKKSQSFNQFPVPPMHRKNMSHFRLMEMKRQKTLVPKKELPTALETRHKLSTKPSLKSECVQFHSLKENLMQNNVTSQIQQQKISSQMRENHKLNLLLKNYQEKRKTLLEKINEQQRELKRDTPKLSGENRELQHKLKTLKDKCEKLKELNKLQSLDFYQNKLLEEINFLDKEQKRLEAEKDVCEKDILSFAENFNKKNFSTEVR